MNFEDIPAYKDIETEISISNIKLQILSSVYVKISIGAINKFLINYNNVDYSFDILDKSKESDIALSLTRGLAYLAQIISISENRFFIRIKFFSGSLIDGFRNVNILVDDRITEKLTIRENRNNIYDALKKTFTIEDKYFLIYKGNSDDEDIKLNAFALYSPKYDIHVEFKNDENNVNKFCEATRLVQAKNRTEKPLFLIESDIVFSSRKEYLSNYAKARLNDITSLNDSYFAVWDKYGEEEGNLLLEKAKKVGLLHFDKVEDAKDGQLRFFIQEDIPEVLENSVNIELELTTIHPEYEKNPNITWKEFIEFLIKQKQEKKGTTNTRENSSKGYDGISIVTIEDNYIDVNGLFLRPEDVDVNEYFFIMSFGGEIPQIERRNDARQKILSGNSANPQLGLIIEETGTLNARKQPTTHIEPISNYVRQKIFPKNPPTLTQTKAIEIALNTPDIALIQGPPGTGKTTVINAIIERLNEIQDKAGLQHGEVLVTAFQHCAVENVKSRVNVNGLPTIKFGGKEEDNSRSESGKNKDIEDIINSIREKLEIRYPSLRTHKIFLSIEKEYVSYITSPSANKALALLRKLLNISAIASSSDCSCPIRKLIRELEDKDISKNINFEEDISIVRRIRITKEGFIDDGIDSLKNILLRFDNILSENEKSGINCLIKTNKFDADLIRHLKEKLFDLVLPKIEFNLEKPNVEVLKVVEDAIAVVKHSYSDKDKLELVLSEYLNELDNNIFGARDALKELSFVYAATVQQCEGREIQKAKGKKTPNYDSVIVDEAARTTPRDLLIPMAKAEKRIILVGDQRQLPHIIDDSILDRIDDIEKKGNGTNEDITSYIRKKIKESMFGYLFNRLKVLEKADGIQRTITLDAQYRMHPLLGGFVSDNFYKPYGEEFRSDLGAEYFTHNIKLIGEIPALWVDVPLKLGESKRAGTSWIRNSEAKSIANCLKNKLLNNSDKKLTFGIITFYKAQVNEITNAIKEAGIYDENRISIGTVDSFQGMEFDIVMLSMVRSRKITMKPTPITLFGHLMMENRLCVAMSRQKKLLVMVGDAEFATTELARKSIPAISNFYDICKSHGKIIDA